MQEVVLGILGVAVVFTLLATVHEGGHCLAAKAVGLRVDEFAVGVGPRLWSRKIGHTEYSFRAIPIGGFNRIPGMNPSEDMQPGFFYSAPVWKRQFVIAAGAIANFLFAMVIIIGLLLMNGLSTPTTQVASVFPDTPAFAAGLQAGDKITAINENPLLQWEESDILAVSNASHVDFTVQRSESTLKIQVTKMQGESPGFQAVMTHRDLTVMEAVRLSAEKTIGLIALMWKMMASILLQGDFGQLAGPIGVMKLVSQTAQSGWEPYITFTALFSINIGVFNLLPLPLLDGGHLVIGFIESLFGRRPTSREVGWIQKSGLGLIACLLVIGTYQDVLRLLS